MKSLTLENGAVFRSFWGGNSVSAMKLRDGREVGDCSMLRVYHDVSLVHVDGVPWVHSYGKDRNYPGDYHAHCDWLSLCGNYKVSRYFDDRNRPYFMVYDAYTWRASLKSTFGKYVPGVGNARFKSFEDAARAANKHAKQQ